MSDASHELQIAIVEALKDHVGLSALISGRVYDRVPAGAIMPYISFGPEQEVPDVAECVKGGEVFIQLDVWSRTPGFGEVKKVADLVREILDEFEVELDSNALLFMEFDGRRVLRDPDGLTSHAALTFRALIEHV
jgi:hypothetical protein